MKAYLDASYLFVNILHMYAYATNNFEMYLLIIERFHVTQPMARLHKQEVEAQLWRQPF